MKKYDTNRFYVGVLHISLTRSSPLVASVSNIVTEEEHKMFNLLSGTISNGALDLSYDYEFNLSGIYEHLYTIFYQDSDGDYYCLHNGVKYSKVPSGSHCSDLVPLTDIVPKYGYNLPDKVTTWLALRIFDGFFGNKSRIIDNSYILYNKEKFDINSFFLGTLILCHGYYDGEEEHSINLPYQIMLNKQKLCLGGSLHMVDPMLGDDAVSKFLYYKSIFLKLSKYDYYNINNHRLYDMRKLEEPLSDNISITKPLVKTDLFRNEDREITIPKILKKNKNMV